MGIGAADRRRERRRFYEIYEEATPATCSSFCVLAANPSSIINCIDTARQCALGTRRADVRDVGGY